MTNKAVFENGKTYFGINGIDANLRATFLNVLVRPSCYDCKFKGFPRVSDITIGDYWRNKYDYDPLDDNTGTSYIMLHNSKAKALFEEIKSSCQYRKIDFECIIGANQKAVSSISHPFFSRSDFYEKLQNTDFITLVDEYSELKEAKQSFIRRVKRQLRSIFDIFLFYSFNPVTICSFIYYNFFCSRIKSNFSSGDVLFVKNTKLRLAKESVIKVCGKCVVNPLGLASIIKLGRGAQLIMDNNRIGSGVMIEVEEKSFVSFGFKTTIDDNVSIHSQTGVTMGAFSLIETRAVIDDSNNGIVLFNECNKQNYSINLGNHVLVSKGSIIRGGTTLGDESIVKEYSIVDGSFERQSVVSGNPAILIANNLNWKYNF